MKLCKKERSLLYLKKEKFFGRFFFQLRKFVFFVEKLQRHIQSHIRNIEKTFCFVAQRRFSQQVFPDSFLMIYNLYDLLFSLMYKRANKKKFNKKQAF